MSNQENSDEIKEELKKDEVIDRLEEELVAEVDEIENLKAQVKEWENKYYTAYADAQNMSKRAKIDAENLVLNKIGCLVENIIPVLDNFERAINVKSDDKNVQNFLKGFEMLYQQLYQTLEMEGISQIEAVGKEFDPNLHESIEVVSDENYGNNIVVEELQKGYKFRSKVIRPTLVKINEIETREED